jgi:UDP-GlcNAc:undecaprenyl-phosphate GlcNAc-1-phosphate transferase
MLVFGLLGFGIAFATSVWIINSIAPRIAHRREFHQTHTTLVPRWGGVALAAAFIGATLLGFFWLPNADAPIAARAALAISALAMFGLGFWDDLSPLGARKKLLGQILISIMAFGIGLRIESFKNPMTGHIYYFDLWFSMAATVFWFVAMTNLINLIDGMDGLAGGISLMLMCLLAYVAFAGHPFLCGTAVAMAGALCAFLRFNFPPARIHLGDGGAYFLGFLIGALSLQNSNKGAVAAALIAPVFALALPILDVALSIVRRGCKGLPIFRPDRRHIHHRLLQSGLSRRRAVLVLYGVSSIFLVIAFAAFVSDGRLTPILFGCVFLVLLVAVPSFGIVKNWLTIGAVVGTSLDARKDIHYALVVRNWMQMEAERSRSINDLWNDFTFMARKLGFRKLVLGLDGQVCVWEDRPAPPDTLEHHAHYQLQIGARAVTLDFTTLAKAMTDNRFSLLSELAAETWLNSARRWFQRADVAFELPGRARVELRSDNIGGEAFGAPMLQ